MKQLLQVCALLVVMCALAVPARATTMTVSSVAIPNWRYTTSGTVQLRLYVDRAFITGGATAANIPIQPGSPDGGNVYKIVTCTVTGPDGGGNYSLSIPTFTIDSSDNGKPASARYSAWFYAGNRKLAPYYGFEAFSMPHVFASSMSTTGSWSEIYTFNHPLAVNPPDNRTYSAPQIDQKIADAVTTAGGLFTLNGLSGTSQTFADDTNVTIVSASSTHTLTWAGQLALARGGTGSSTASGARSNLGAAASGANSDVTSLAGLTTPLSGAQGGTGFGTSTPYTVGSILYPSTTTALAQLVPGTAGHVLTSQGAGLAPVWSAAAGTIGGGGASGRLAFWTGATTLSSNANLAWDDSTSRLSLGAPPASTQRLNLAAGDYVAGYGANLYAGYHLSAISAAQRRIAGVATDTYVASATGAGLGISYTTTNTDVVNLSPDQPVVMRYTQSGATGYTGLAPVGIVATNGFDFKFGMFGAYNTTSANSSNVFQFASDVKSYNTAPVVAVFGGGTTMASGAQAWGANLSGFAAASSSTAIADETDFGMIGDNLTSPAAYGKVIVAVGQTGVPLTAGAGKATFNGGVTYHYVTGSYLQLQSNTTVFMPTFGINFNNGGNQVVNPAGALINATVGNVASEGINFAGLDTTNAALLIRNSDYIKANNVGNTVSMKLAYLNTGDDVVIGDNDALGNTETLIEAQSAPEIVRALNTRRLGINTRSSGTFSVTPTHTLQARTTATRTITGTVATNSGSPTVSGTSTTFITDVRPGSTFVVNGDATIYKVLNVASNTSLTLTANAGSTLTNRTVTTDDAMALWEAEDGTDHVEIDNQGRLKVTGGGPHPVGATAANQDLLGAIRIVGRTNANKRFFFDLDETDNNAYINSMTVGTGWNNIVMQAGGGFVGIGTAFPSATLTVAGSGAKTADFILSNYESLATNTSGTPRTQIGNNYTIWPLTTWLGPSIGARFMVKSAFDASGNRTGYPATFHGGKVLFAPDGAASPIYDPAAMIHVYAQPVVALAGVGADGQTVSVTNGSAVVTAAGGASFSSMLAGESIQVGTDTATYQILSVDSASQVTLTTNYAGSTATVEQAWGDPVLLLLQNGSGATALEVRGGRTSVSNTLVQKRHQTALASATALSISNAPGNVYHVSGTTTITSVTGGVDGQVITLIFDGVLTFTDGSNLRLAGNFVTTADDTITLVFDSTANAWFELARAVN